MLIQGIWSFSQARASPNWVKLAGSYILKIIVLSSVGAPVWLMSCPLSALHLSDYQTLYTQAMKITIKLEGEHAPIKLQLKATIKYQTTRQSKYMQVLSKYMQG